MAGRSPTVLVDTSVLIDVLHGRAKAIAAVRELAMRGYGLVTSCINVGELYAGMRRGEKSATEQLLAGFERVAVTEDIAKRAGAMVAERRRLGRTHSLDDMVIAATAMEHESAVFTENLKDFDIPGLELYRPEPE